MLVILPSPFAHEIPVPECDRITRFYRCLAGFIMPGDAIVHSHPREDIQAQGVFGVDLRDICQVGLQPAEVGLWIATPSGMDNSDFFDGIARSSQHGLIATNFPRDADKPRNLELEHYVTGRLSMLGYAQETIKGTTSAPDDQYSLERGFFIPSSMRIH